MESRPRARGGIASIGEVLCTSPPVGRALTRSGLVMVNAPFGNVWCCLCPSHPSRGFCWHESGVMLMGAGRRLWSDRPLAVSSVKTSHYPTHGAEHSIHPGRRRGSFFFWCFIFECFFIFLSFCSVSIFFHFIVFWFLLFL